MPQVLQLNEMQPCWGKKGSPIALDTLPSKYAHTDRAPFSSCSHTVPAPTRLMFIHQPLTGQMQGPFKTKSDLFINDGGRAGRRDGPAFLRSHRSHVWRDVCPPLTTGVTSIGEEGGAETV